MKSIKDYTFFSALRQCWTVPSCQNDQCRTKGCASGTAAQGATVEGAQNLLQSYKVWLGKLSKQEGGEGARFMLGTERIYSFVQH